ncbi:MAG: SEL1-like repeat protein, partial [Alphaproteobacteria bacterium]|nr:SEL1-like repeat protein [Alphaproteobacteria bacterium]
MTLPRYVPAFLIALMLSGLPAERAMAQAFQASLEDGLSAFNYGDNELAQRHFWRLAGQGDAVAQYYLAYMMDTGLGMRKDIAQAASWYRKSADQDYLPAVSYMGY